VSRGTYAFRAAAFLTAGAYAVHELRYVGAPADDALHHHDHGYVSAVAPLITLLVAGLAGWLLWAAMQPARPELPRVSFRRSWACSSACLLGVYTAQELLEGQVSHGHPSLVTDVFGGGGWIAIPLAVAVGAAIALALSVVRAVEHAPAMRVIAALGIPAPRATPLIVVPAGPVRPARSPLALRRAGRAPPAGL
jgi:hypothetical protein